MVLTGNYDDDASAQLLIAITSAICDGLSLEEQLALALAEPICKALRKHYASEHLYVPVPDREERNREIRAMWNGKNREEIMRRFEISRATFYNVIGKRAASQ